MNGAIRSTSTIPVDLFNPGQVFACLGLMEAADQLLGGALACFDWRDPTQPLFHLTANGNTPPVIRVLSFLDRASARAVAPAGTTLAARWNRKWGDLPLVATEEAGYSIPPPSSPATFVCVLSDGAKHLTIDYWGDGVKHTGRDNAKFWGGSGGYPGAALARDALRLVAGVGKASAAAADPFSVSARQTSSFRFDWRRDYVPLDAGFSPNKHGNIVCSGFPLVELLAAIGMSHARPFRPDRRNKLLYRYAVVGASPSDDPGQLPPTLVRAALGDASLPLPTRRFRMRLDCPGQEGQGRAITTVTEEITP
jgi:CRISPR-associated protein Csx14